MYQVEPTCRPSALVAAFSRVGGLLAASQLACVVSPAAAVTRLWLSEVQVVQVCRPLLQIGSLLKVND